MELTRRQRMKIADICADIAQVSLASIAISFFLDTFDVPLALLGVGTPIGFWLLSLLASKQIP